MINGAHVVIHTLDPEGDRAFFRDVIKFPNIDVGGGWLIFKLPDSELAFHPTEKDEYHALMLICEDINKFVGVMKEKQIEFSELKDAGWGIVTDITLPGGGKMGVYEPKHERP